MPVNEILQSIYHTLLTALLPVIMAGIAVGTKWAMAKIKEVEISLDLKKNTVEVEKDKITLDSNIRILDLVSRVTEGTVLSLQSLANDFKLASEDGILSTDEKKQLHDKALEDVKKLVKTILPDGMKSSIVCIDKVLSIIVDKEIEATIARIKLTNPTLKVQPGQGHEDIDFNSLNNISRQ